MKTWKFGIIGAGLIADFHARAITDIDNAELSGFCDIAPAIHMIDMLCDLMPPVESVQAYTATLGHQIEAEDTATAILRFSNGALGVIYGSTASYPGQYKRFEITGTKGTVVYLEDSFTIWEFADKRDEDDEILKQYAHVSRTGGGVADPAEISHKYHTNNFKAFIEALDTGGKFSLDGSEARKAVEVILAIYRSAREQKCIKL